MSELKMELEAGRLAENTNKTLDILLGVAYRQLKIHGHHEYAERLKNEWHIKWFGYVYQLRDIGDHEPMSEWLAEAYKKIESLLGKDLCEFFHLDDINIVNYALPVVFNCKIAFNSVDYRQHFVPLAGVIAYWVPAGTCILLSSGTMVFFCSPIGMLCEHVMVTFIAPGISDRVYDRFCGFQPYQLTSHHPIWD